MAAGVRSGRCSRSAGEVKGVVAVDMDVLVLLDEDLCAQVHPLIAADQVPGLRSDHTLDFVAALPTKRALQTSNIPGKLPITHVRPTVVA
jgi:hypothetical protein